MTPETVLTVMQQTLEVITLLIIVILIPALIAGLIVSMFQAATSINEQTLSFIPKLLVTILVLMVAGPWMLSLVTNYTVRLFENIPYLIG
ncbi:MULTISPECIES: flagellar biosynthesis protein FliQ [Methylophaga]|jgi:flagellar biosynthetic protein FliQ|uniref:Flagellar biosynthetic protein FliQ n=1 Tax=Methylophaga nitratireducenticrescens TaxID=754476 RepID=I1XMU7_METNJ|nr:MULTISPECIES: flagellar biosynthesis protein FliQ [Methylophaga]AFI85716.1 flagellar export apparatus protein FliQ [Methylophaga nitratireducenticrescens]AUZ85443.1 flagellar export apparatus protein FliQ [Methylophaga nitratireducenticrescens]MAL49807.1 flagellar biosynthetic protein FliQ [Methylophaga sp.]MAP26253.1 flagellar biosynthetic protein FliQ [Methylophaga sp.]MBP24642.1 flagellar biosynthetic protein FliQ [Methylophaga sp.]|tara:strand:- start:714 stop:983 length:270 start_codon:yes stop_codon:yes gene_type:complete